MLIRRLGPNDAEVLVELFGAVLPEFGERLLGAEAPADFLADPAAFALGA